MICENNYINIVLIINVILVITIIYFLFTKSTEHFADPTALTIDNIRDEINKQYNMDIEAMRNLGAISKSLLTGTNYHSTTVGTPGTLTIPADTTSLMGKLNVSGGLNVTGDVTFNSKNTNIMEIFPRFMVIAWYSQTIPKGWRICDGGDGTPDLRGRFIMGSGQTQNTVNSFGTWGAKSYDYTANFPLGETGGTYRHTLSEAEMPNHSHKTMANNSSRYNSPWSNSASWHSPGQWWITSADEDAFLFNTNKIGGNQPHNNMPPYFVLNYIMKL
jgi:microcystin-dependent protein